MQETLEEHATLYALSLLEPGEMELFEERLRTDPELTQFVRELQDLQAIALKTEAVRVGQSPAAHVKECILKRIETLPQQRYPELVAIALQEAQFPLPAPGEAVIVSDREGLLEWVNPAFIEMCGHGLDELRGRKPGSVLQGEESDPRAIESLRRAVRERRALVQQIVNYHKDGSRYVVEIDLRPVSTGFIAVERKLVAA